MNNKALKFILLLILLIAQGISKIFAQHCYIYNGYKWATNSVTFNINSNLGDAFATQEEYEVAIILSAAQWNGAGSIFEFIYGTDSYDYERGQEPAGFYQVGKYYQFAGPIGLTDINVNPNNPNEIIKASSYFNKYYFFTTDPDYTEYDIHSNILHEFGHMMGLAHCDDYEESIMWTPLHLDDGNEITGDDEDGLEALIASNPIIPLVKNPFSIKQLRI